MTRPLPERLHPLSPLFLTLSYLWNLWPLLLYPLADLFFLGQGARLISLLILGGSLLVCLIPALLHYTHFRFRLEDEQIVLTSGFFFKQTRVVPLARVHNVSLRQNPLHRLFGVGEVNLESGGTGAESEGRFNVLKLADARRLEALLMHRPDAGEKPETPAAATPAVPVEEKASVPGPEENLLPMNSATLLRYGFFSDRGVLLAASAYLLTQLSDEQANNLLGSLTQWLLGHLWRLWFSHFAWAEIWFWLLLAVGLLLAAELATIVAAFISHGNFELSERDGRLIQRRGLLSRVESQVPLDKIQVWKVKQSPLQRLNGYYRVEIDTVVLGPELAARGIKELLPLVDGPTLSRLLQHWTGCDPLAVPLQPVHPLAGRRILRGYLLGFALLCVVIQILAVVVKIYGLAVAMPVLFLLLLPLLPPLARRRHQAAGWALLDNRLHWRDGWLWSQHSFARLERLQALQLQHGPIDRRYAMTDLLADSLGSEKGQTSPLVLRWLPLATARSLLARLLPAR